MDDWKERIPEKFHRDTLESSLEAMSKSYADLEKQKSAPPADPPKDQPPTDPNDLRLNRPPVAGSIEEIVQNAGLSMDSLSKKFMEHGKLDPADYAALEAKAGLPRAAVDEIAKGRLAGAAASELRLNQIVMAATQAAGGKETYDRLRNWAVKHLSAEEQAYFDSQVNGEGASAMTARAAVEWVKSKAGVTPNTPSDGDVRGGNGFRGGGGEAFSSHEEYVDQLAKAADAITRGNTGQIPEDVRSRIMATMNADSPAIRT